MSKFVEVFKKVQHKRRTDNEPAPAAKNNEGTVSTFGKISPEKIKQDANWENRIQSVKNASPQEHIVMMKHPESMPAEQYRMLKASIKAEIEKQQAKIVLLTSSLNSEGKTVTSANLALALAEDRNAQVLLIDADLRRGRIAHYLGFGKRQGLSEMLSDDLHPKKIFLKSSVPNLTVIPAGGPNRKPSEVLDSDKFKTFIHSLRPLYDYILIDAPPVMACADTAILSRLVDGVVFVAQLGRTPKTVIQHAHQLLEQSGAKILGQVLTHVEFSSSEYRYYEPYGYGLEKDRDPKKLFVKKSLLALRDLEEKFNAWWDAKVQKKTRVPAEIKVVDANDLTPTDEPPQDAETQPGTEESGEHRS